MAATLGNDVVLAAFPYVIEEAYYTTLVPGATVTHTHKGPDGVVPFKVECHVVQRAASRDPVFFSYDESENDATNDYVYLQFDTVAGGDLTDAQVKVLFYFLSQASGGISA